MVDQTNNTDSKAAAEAPAKVAEATANTATKLVEESAKAGKRARAATARRAKRAATPRKAATARKTATRRSSTSRTKTARVTVKAAPRTERTENVNFNATFPAFDAFPAVNGLQSVFAQAGERSQDAVRRSQQIAEQLADMTRGNVEAIAEAGRIAAEGARSLGRDAIAKSREGVEEAAEAIRTLAEAKSPTELVQLQSDFARASFDRMVAQSSRFTETWVKLAGEAIQPLSNRATTNVERVNSLVA